MAAKKTQSSLTKKLGDLTARDYTASQKKVLVETAEWWKQQRDAGESRPKINEIRDMLNRDYGIVINYAALERRLNR